jgi:general L-amino acid transport system substrate-binding protein|tara:strand:+ start:1244 stop:2407 length:1164 start_codon:yes stop_codon:yes gene_type:complete
MIIGGKVVILLAWLFWMMIVDNSVYGSPPNDRIDDNINKLVQQLEKLKAIKLRDTGESEEYNPTYGTTFDRVIKRGFIICGTNDEFPGFSEEVYDGVDVKWKGFDVDICRAVAAAVFGDSDAVEYEIINGVTRFTTLKDGTIDILSAATTYTFTRNVLKKFEFLPTTYYDGQGFITKKTLGVSSAKQMHGAKICFKGSGTAAKNIADFMQLHEIKYIPVAVSVNEKTKDVYLRGDCDMYGTDRSGLASNRLGFDSPERHIILPEIISKEPLGPVVKYGDQKWSDIVRWTVYVLFIAEEMGINSKNIDRFIENKDPNIQRFMGEKNGVDHPHLGAKLGLSPTWSYDVIKQVGNYEEIFNRNIKKKLGLKRGLNKLYSDGGLLYSPPLK